MPHLSRPRLPLLLSLLLAVSWCCGPARAATFTIVDGDETGLRNAIATSNANGQNDTINLAANGEFDFSNANNTTNGPNGLPVVGADGGHTLTINGNDALLWALTGSYRLVYAGNGANLTLNSLTIQDGEAFGALPNGGGGGIYNDHATLTLRDVTLYGNRASFGGGLYNDGGTVSLRRSTLWANGASAGGGLTNASGTVALTNCTIANNGSSSPPGDGSGLDNENGTATLLHCTVANNAAAAVGSNLLNAGGSATLTVGNTILTNGAGKPNLVNNGGAVISQGYNLSSDNGGGLLTQSGDQLNADTKLDPSGVQRNGGLTPSIMLLPGSPALDQGKDLSGTHQDQRGLNRPVDVAALPNAPGGDGSDIGAVEVNDTLQGGPSFEINTTSGSVDGACGVTHCSWPDALLAANAYNAAHANAGVTITFKPAVFAPAGAPHVIELNTYPPVINSAITILGPGANLVTVQPGSAAGTLQFTLLSVYKPYGAAITPNVTLSGVTLAHGNGFYGGALYASESNLTVTDCILRDNTGVYGGAIGDFQANITLTNCTLSGNAALFGGALRNESSTMTLTGCTLNDNAAREVGGFSAGAGGAIENDGFYDATLTLTNCTLSGNSATNSRNDSRGGAIWNQANGNNSKVTLSFCTLSGNSAVNGGGIANEHSAGSGGSAVVTLHDTILRRGATGVNLLNTDGTVTSQGTNLSSDAAGGDGTTGPGGLLNATGDIRNTDPRLDPAGLQDNGGPTQTIALLPQSPARDKGNNAVAPATDQRGVMRPQPVGSRVDSGAFELVQTLQSGPNFEVNTIDEHSDGFCTNEDCTLWDAMNAANANSDASIVTFQSGLTGTITTLLQVVGINVLNPVTIQGPGARLLTISGGHTGRVFHVASPGSVTFSGLTVAQGNAPENSLDGNGGGIYVENSQVTCEQCAFSGNAAVSGGGLFNDGGGTLTLDRCTFSGNTAGYGAGVENDGTATITNCTLAGNVATNSGGGIMNNGGTLTVHDSTIANNAVTVSAPDFGGGGIEDQGDTGPHIGGSIIAGNTSPLGPNVHGAFTSDGFNLLGSSLDSSGFTNGANHDRVGVSNPQLGALRNNGGPTDTMAPLPTSPAIDAGNKFGLSTDQRGLARPYDDPAVANASDGSDIGAYERQAPTLSINDVTVTEGNAGTANAVFTVSLRDGPNASVSVNYATTNGTATAGSDYTTTAGTLTFTVGQTSKTISVPVRGDTLDEANETFKVNLAAASGAAIGDGLGVGTIIDNDPTPHCLIDDVTVTEANGGSVNAVFHLTLSAASGRTITVTYKTADGTATAPADYTAIPSTTLTFTPGQTSKTITVGVKGDTLDEANETFKVVLQSATFAAIVDDKGVGTITDNDPLPALSISDAPALNEGNAGSHNALFTVTLTGATGRTVTVNYATANGTATADSDYTAQSGTLTFSPGQTSKTLPVQVLGDTTVELDETFKVNLSGAGFATISASQGIHTITNDDASE